MKGLIDLQVNGFKGVDFSDPALSEDQIGKVGRWLFDRGTNGYCPTLITASFDTYTRNLPLLARHVSSESEAKILGIHLEGPFINPQDGVRGIHPPKHVRPPSIDDFERLREWSQDRIALITIAPEMPEGIEIIEHIRKTTRTVVSIGHSLAGAEAVRLACEAGARLATHLGNGLPELIHRHSNPLWPILAEDLLSVMLITDGYHVPADFIRTVVRNKTHKRIIVTSDLMCFAGLTPGEYDYRGIRVVLKSNGHLHIKDKHGLAGAAHDMCDCMNFMQSLEILSLDQLEDVGRNNALNILGLE